MSCLNDTVGYFHDSCGVLLWDHFNSSSGVGKNARNDVELWIAGFPNVNEKQSTKFSHLTRSHKISESPQFTSPTLQKKQKQERQENNHCNNNKPPSRLRQQTTSNNTICWNLSHPPTKKKQTPWHETVFFNFPFPDAPPAATGIFTYIYPQKISQM